MSRFTYPLGYYMNVATIPVDQANHAGLAVSHKLSKQPTLTPSDQVQRIVPLLDSLHPVQSPSGVLVALPANGEAKPIPLTPKRGTPPLARLHVAGEYFSSYGTRMPIAAYNAAIDQVTLRCATQPTPVATQSVPAIDPYEHAIKVAGHANLFILPGEAIVTVRQGRDGTEKLTTLWDKDMVPIVHKRVRIPNAISGYDLFYDLQIGNDRGLIPYDDLKMGRWVSKYPGVAGVADSRNHGQYVNAIMTLGTQVPLTNGYAKTGYYNQGDDLKRAYVYLLPDGRYLDATGTVHAAGDNGVELTTDIVTNEQEKALWKQHQTDTSSSVDQRKAAIRFLTDLSPGKQPLMLLGHMAMAITHGVRNPHYGAGHTMAIVGDPHTGKTALAGLARCLVAPYRRKPALDATFEDTDTDIEFTLADRASFPSVVDDLKRGDYYTPGKRQEYVSKVDRVVRPTYNDTAVRNRRNSKLQRVPSNVIKTCPTMTMEVLPDVSSSCLRRMVIVDIAPGEVKVDSIASTDVALDQIPQHVAAINNLGYRLIVRVLKYLDKYGVDGLATRFNSDYYSSFEKRLRNSIQQLWSANRPGERLPDESNSIIENAAYDLLGLHLLDQVSECGSTLVHDVYTSLVNTIYANILRIAGSATDVDGYTTIDTAMQAVFEDIGNGKNHDGHTWVAEQYTSKAPMIQPQAHIVSGDLLPSEQWGYGKQHKLDRAMCIAYLDQDVTYVTGEFRRALLAAINSLDDMHVTSEKALSQLLDRQGWLVRSNESKCTKQIYPHGKRIGRVLVLDNSKLFPLLGIARLDTDTVLPANVTPLPTPAATPTPDDRPDIVAPHSSALDDIMNTF